LSIGSVKSYSHASVPSHSEISLEQVSQIFVTRDDEEVVALKDVTLDVRKNEFVAIVGRSGCGKSTLLRIVGGLTQPTYGEVTIDGIRVDRPGHESGIVFQNPTLLPWATVTDNVIFPLKLMGKLEKDSFDKAHQLLKMVGLFDFRNRYPGELSGGMQQRTAICRALIHDPNILLMDEPFGALDALTREEMSMELLRIWSERPKTILFVTHSITEAVLLSDRVLVMSPRPGRIVDIIDVNLPRPRSFMQESSDEFQEASQRIRDHIFGADS
jgi:NitT/TauT family transport system ATP-binding protein